MRRRWAVSLAAALTLLLGAPAVAASATPPVQLGAAHVLDDAGVLTASDESAANERLEQLYTDTETDLYVVFVDEFTDPSNSQEWADAVALGNGLGVSQYLLAIATESRQYYISADSQGPLSDDELTAVETAIRPQLSSGDWLGAIETAADQFDAALGGGGAGGASGTSGWLWFGLLAVVVIVIIGWFILRGRRKKLSAPDAGAGPAQIDPIELARRASAALIETDDAVKTSEQELGFAKAQFGDAATTAFEEALGLARANLGRAFMLQQQLDDEVPDAAAQTEAWNAEIVRLCEEANRELDDKAAAFDELRKLEANAPEAHARVQEQRQAAASRIDDAAASLARLRTTYSPDALATIDDNPEQAQERIAFADAQLAAAQAAIGAGRGGEAAVGIRAAEEAVGQAKLLEDAIDKLAVDLAQGERDAASLLLELDQDIAAASALPDPDGRVAAAVTATRQQMDAARGGLGATGKRPLAALQALEAADAQIDAVLAGVRDAQARAQRATQQLAQLITQAQAQVSAAEDYITARRGAVGSEARTRLAEAGAALVLARQLAATSPEQALESAQRANALAAQSIQHAQNDVGAFSGGGMLGSGGGMFGPSGGNQGGSQGGGMLGAVLGGIVINSLLSGGGGRSSSGGVFGGGGGGLFGGGGGGRGRSGGGGFSSGSFGGGGTRGRRGGGRF